MKERSRLGVIPLMVRRSLRQHIVSSAITVFSVALGVGLVMAVFGVTAQANRAFRAGPVGSLGVLGARGSQLQLVLNTVFHLEQSPGNVAWSLYQAVKNDGRVEFAIPQMVGDNYKGYRIVGTTPEMFERLEFRGGKKLRLARGNRIFEPLEQGAIIGSTVAQMTDLDVGSTFQPYHGLQYQEGMTPHANRYTVLGVLEPTNTPTDRVVWISIEGMFRMEGHLFDGESYVGAAEVPDEHKELSAVLVRFRNDRLGLKMADEINRQGTIATLAFPVAGVMNDIFDKLGWMTQVLEIVAYLVVLVAAGTILASIYNTMNERRREFAILRALGASRRVVMSAIMAEAGVLAFFGSVVGFVFYAGIFLLAGATIRQQTGVVLDVWSFHPSLYLAPCGMTALGLLAGLAPALKAYSTEVARNLVPTS